MKGGAGLARRQLGVTGLVIAGIIGETAVKGQPILLVHLGSQNRNQAGIDSTGHVGANGDIGAQVKFQALIEEGTNLTLEIPRSVVEINVVVDVPVSRDLDRAVLDAEPMARQELVHSLE